MGSTGMRCLLVQRVFSKLTLGRSPGRVGGKSRESASGDLSKFHHRERLALREGCSAPRGHGGGTLQTVPAASHGAGCCYFPEPRSGRPRPSRSAPRRPAAPPPARAPPASARIRFPVRIAALRRAKSGAQGTAAPRGTPLLRGPAPARSGAAARGPAKECGAHGEGPGVRALGHGGPRVASSRGRGRRGGCG